MNSFAMLQALVFEPRRAFEELGRQPKVLFPLLLLALGSAGLALWYYQVVDLEWLTDRQIRSSRFATALTEAQIEERVKQAGEHPLRAGIFACLATGVGLVIGHLISALYYTLAGKVTNVQRSFKQWFALSCWSGMPAVLTLIPAAFVLMSATTVQISEGDLRPLSLNSLLFQRAFNEPGYALLSSIGVPEILAILLAIVGVHTWSGRSWLFSAVFALIPVVVIFGAIAFFTMGSS